MTKQNIVRVSNSFTRAEIHILKDIIDTATTQDFRGRNHLMKFLDKADFTLLYRKLASMKEKADNLHVRQRTGGGPVVDSEDKEAK